MADDVRSLASLKAEARRAGTSDERLLELAALDDALARQIARLAHTSASVLEVLAHHESPAIRVAIANHPTTPPATLATLGTSDRAALLKALARHPLTPVATLDAIASDRRPGVREALLERAITPTSTLLLLADDDRFNHHALCMRQRESIGRSRSVIDRLLARDAHVRRSVATFVPLDRATAERVFGDESAYVRAALFGNRGVVDHHRWVERLLVHPDARTRMYIARGPLHEAYVDHFLVDEAPRVRAALAAQMQLSPGVIARLARDSSPAVRGAIARRFSDIPASIAWRLADDDEPGVRAMIATSRHVPPDALARLAADRVELVRFLVGCHPDTPSSALARLASDPGELAFDVACFHGADARLRVGELAAARVRDAPAENAIVAALPNTDRQLRDGYPAYFEPPARREPG